MMLDTTGCIGNSILTATGRYFDYLDPQPEQIDIRDIATALSNTCRFAGHCRFYSVAEHSNHCAILAMNQEPRNGAFAFHALMHDAAESYVGDMPKPLKMMMPEFREVEHRVERAIRDKFRITSTYDAKVKQIDLCMLKAEKIALFPTDKTTWHGFNELPNVDVELHGWNPEDVSRQFLKLFHTLRALKAE